MFFPNEKRFSRKREQRKVKFSMFVSLLLSLLKQPRLKDDPSFQLRADDAFLKIGIPIKKFPKNFNLANYKEPDVQSIINRELKKAEKKGVNCFINYDEIVKFTKRFDFKNYDDKKLIEELKELIISSYEMADSFWEVLNKFKKERGFKKDSDLYIAANVSKKVFNSIKNNYFYCPSKQTIMAFVISLRLNEKEARELFSSAGIELCSSRADDTLYDFLIRSNFIQNPYVDINMINDFLDELNLPPLGTIAQEDRIKKKDKKEKTRSQGARLK